MSPAMIASLLTPEELECVVARAEARVVERTQEAHALAMYGPPGVDAAELWVQRLDFAHKWQELAEALRAEQRRRKPE